MSFEPMDQGQNDGAKSLTTNASAASLPPAKLNLRKLEKIQRVLQFGAALVLLVFVVLIAFSFFQLRAIKQTIAREQETLRTQQQTIKDNQILIDSQKSKIESQQNAISALQTGIREVSVNDPKQGEQIKQAVEASIRQDVSAKQIPPRIYIQISREDQRQHAARVARQLQASGYIVPGIENVREKGPATSELRYCQSDDVAQKDLEGIANALQTLRVKLGRPRLLRNCGKVRPRHYEIWFGEDF